MTELNIDTGAFHKDHRNMHLGHRGDYNDPKKRHNFKELQERFEKKERVYEQKIVDLQEALKRMPLSESKMSHQQLERKRRIEHKLNACQHHGMKVESELDYLEKKTEKNNIEPFVHAVKQGKHKTKLQSQNIIHY